mmetsp:Transcript_51989/g.145952  ORF Transcript_51989/g.145952 Transcript_51989/m.145952 type:complete len:234 (-) Transcript_51989:419-1120(-)
MGPARRGAPPRAARRGGRRLDGVLAEARRIALGLRGAGRAAGLLPHRGEPRRPLRVSARGARRQSRRGPRRAAGQGRRGGRPPDPAAAAAAPAGAAHPGPATGCAARAGELAEAAEPADGGAPCRPPRARPRGGGEAVAGVHECAGGGAARRADGGGPRSRGGGAEVGGEHRHLPRQRSAGLERLPGGHAPRPRRPPSGSRHRGGAAARNAGQPWICRCPCRERRRQWRRQQP